MAHRGEEGGREGGRSQRRLPLCRRSRSQRQAAVAGEMSSVFFQMALPCLRRPSMGQEPRSWAPQDLASWEEARALQACRPLSGSDLGGRVGRAHVGDPLPRDSATLLGGPVLPQRLRVPQVPVPSWLLLPGHCLLMPRCPWHRREGLALSREQLLAEPRVSHPEGLHLSGG